VNAATMLRVYNVLRSFGFGPTTAWLLANKSANAASGYRR